MTLDELIEALKELKKSGKAVDKLPVYFTVDRFEIREINKIRVASDLSDPNGNGIYLS